MKKITLALSAAALALTGGTFVLAAQDKTRPDPDTNSDGQVTLAEMQAHGDAMFARMDVNGDGTINAADREARHAAKFAAADTDKDGELSQAEMQAMRESRRENRAERREARMAEHFAAMDADKSGGVSQAEMQARHEARGERKRGGHHGMRGGRHGGMMMFGMADADGDKAVTRAEFNAALQARFARVDTNGDGVIGPAEHSAAREAMRTEWKARREAARSE